jgi:hypothetical protein
MMSFKKEGAEEAWEGEDFSESVSEDMAGELEESRMLRILPF